MTRGSRDDDLVAATDVRGEGPLGVGLDLVLAAFAFRLLERTLLVCSGAWRQRVRGI
jgi:hypothetical protein